MDQPAPEYDLIVIGAGINGAAIAREAALSGNRVLVLERDDPGSGTSATSTRLIHGGLRYLEFAEFGLVYESLSERERLLRTAPHLVSPLELFLPIYRRSRRGPWQIRAGMCLYDLLSMAKSLPRHRMLSRTETMARLPSLAAEDLRGSAVYFDAQVRYPERLVLENLLDAIDNGATLETRATVAKIIREGETVAGVEWQRDGQAHVVRAAAVVNAAGPWVDSVLAGIAPEPLLGGTKGSHLVVAPIAGTPDVAVYAEAASDGRPFFILPWNRLLLIGTTDERFDGEPGQAAISQAEFDYLVAEAQRLFPSAERLADSVCYTQAGIRPLPRTSGKHPGAITRRHLIRAHANARGLFSIIGGKLTTHRALAVDVMRKLRHLLKTHRRSPTANRPLPGALQAAERDALLAELSAQLGSVQARRLWSVYGGRARDLAAGLAASAELGMVIGPASSVFVGELVHGIEGEYARTLVDLLQRRNMAGLDADFGLQSAAYAADWLVRLGLWDKLRAADELAAYRRYARRFAVPGAPAVRDGA